MALIYEFARPQDEAALEALLRTSDLPYEDVHEHLENFILAREDDALVGSVGLEDLERIGLLRSLAVVPSRRGQGLGRELCWRAFAHGRAQGVEQLYLLTLTAREFFERLGFRAIGRDEAPPEIQATSEFSRLCPETAVVMTGRINAGSR